MGAEIGLESVIARLNPGREMIPDLIDLLFGLLTLDANTRWKADFALNETFLSKEFEQI